MKAKFNEHLINEDIFNRFARSETFNIKELLYQFYLFGVKDGKQIKNQNDEKKEDNKERIIEILKQKEL